MEFFVNESGITTTASRLDTLGSDVGAARAYAADHLSLGVGDTGLIFSHVVLAAGNALDAVTSLLDRVQALDEASARELRATAQLYRESDDEADRRLDASYPRG